MIVAEASSSGSPRSDLVRLLVAHLRVLAPHLRAALLIEPDRLALWLPVCVGVGDATYFACRFEPPRWPALALAATAALVFFMARRSGLLRASGAAMLAASIGFLAAALATSRAPPMLEMPRRAAIVAGRVGAIDLFSDETRRLTLDQPVIDGDPPAARRLRVRMQADDPQTVAVGDRVTVRAMLRDPAPPALPGGRDLQREVFFGGLSGSGMALGRIQIDRQGAAARGVGSRLEQVRESIAARITAILPGPDGAVAATLLTGISTGISQADRAAFAVSGLAHLLAVAGLHLGIVMGLTMGAVRMALAAWEYAALRLPTRQIAAIAALGAGALYMALTGMHLPTIRSLSMAGLGVLALLAGRRAISMRSLGIAAGGLLLTQPESLLEVSFQMSFAAVLALIAGYEALRPMITGLYGEGGWHRRTGLHVFGLFMTSLLAGAASTPYAAFHFGHIQFYFVLANLVAVPVTALWVLPEGLFSLALMPLGLERFALVPMGWGIDLILWLARNVARLPDSSIAVRAMPLWALGGVSFGLIWLCLRRGKWRLLGLLGLVGGLLLPGLTRAPDLLVSSDARLIALRLVQPEGARLLVEQGSGASRITLSDWALAQAAEPQPFPLQGAAGPVSCGPADCRIVMHGKLVLLLRGRKPVAPADLDCSTVALLVSAAPVSPRICPGLPRIDRFSVYRQGADAVWIGPGGITIRSVRDARGARPWVPVPGRKRLPALPMAEAE